VGSRAILAKIEARLGFVPPFFEPAVEHVEVLTSLWAQTEHAYLDNPLPTLFKEKLAALLGRYCEVPYCLVCHTCSLRPLGLGGAAILDLLTQAHPSDEALSSALERLGTSADAMDLARVSDSDEQDIFCLASAVYSNRPLSTVSRERLRQRLSPSDYVSLVAFISYNKMCHEWMAAHPEVSYELDQRYLRNYTPLVVDAPSLADLLQVRTQVDQAGHHERAEVVVSERAAEAPEFVMLTERRLADIIATLNERVASALQSVSQKDALTQELRRAADFAQELLAIVSHDLRNPLNNISMGAQLILKLQPDDSKIASRAQQIIASSRRAERLIYDLLDFSQARIGGGIPVRLQPTDIVSLVRSACDELELAWPENGVHIEHHGDGRGEWDSDRLAQVLSNLLVNAAVHGKQQQPLQLITRATVQSMTIAVHNANRDGPIPEDLLPFLFDPFKRGVARAISSTRSVGLGLYIVREIVQGHRGRVEVVSSAEGGTTFTIHLPRDASCPAMMSSDA
jgi:sigma-B regulation protein RsbU (phosphoserine phosphatase)